MKRLYPMTLAALTTLFYALPALADLQMTVQFTDHLSGENETTVLYLGKDKIRAEQQHDALNLVHITRADKELIWMLNPEQKRYVEISMTQMQRMEQEAQTYQDASRAMLEDYMEGLSEEEKAQYRQYLGMDEEEITPTEYRKGAEQTIGAWRCTVYEGLHNGQRIEQLCTVPLQSLSITKDDFETFYALYAHSGEDKSYGWDWAKMERIGFPVNTVQFENGQAAATTTFLAIEKKNLPASLFEIPSGYSKVSMMEFYTE